MKNYWNQRFRYVFYTVFITGIISLLPTTVAGQVSINGLVTEASTGNILSGAHVLVKSERLTCITDPFGKFNIRGLKPGYVTMEISYIGFKNKNLSFSLVRDTTLIIPLDGSALLGEEVNIIATRAQENYPTPFTSVTSKDLKNINLGKDIPYLIQQTPSVVVTSDAGNGIGYSGMNIRGTDLTRINVTINGIPLNDPESQGVWFVDLPDLASSAGDIQVQRGVGTSTNGAGAFGASVNFMTNDLHQDSYGEVNISGGSFNTFKSTLTFGTGLLSNRFSVDGRLSCIHSDGYIDRAASDLKSYHLSAGYYGNSTTIKFITFSGLENTYQAWNGVPKDSLETNRTYNSCGEYHDNNNQLTYYKNQVDHYQQDHYQFIFSQKLTKAWTLNTALHYTHGQGYYENYKENESFSDYGLNNPVIGNDTITGTSLVNRKMMDNNFFGITFSTIFQLAGKLKWITGGAWNRYHGEHYGKIIWANITPVSSDYNWYFNTGLKTDFNIYSKADLQVNKSVHLFADLQYRHINYKMNGNLDNLLAIDQVHSFDFLNPKAGIHLSLPQNQEMFFSFGVANREPSRNNYKDADPGKEPTNETLQDFELGYSVRFKRLTLEANLYYMNYINQLALTGEINNVGEAVMVNVPHSFRQGVEISGACNLIRDILDWNITATMSRNKIRDFVQYIDLYDAEWNYLGQKAIELVQTDLSFSPSLLFGSNLTWKPFKGASVSLTSKYVGKQFIDNTSDEQRQLRSYFIHGLNISYTVKPKLMNELGFHFSLNNIFSAKYETNGWVYPFMRDNQYAEYNGYFPQAPVNFLAGISIRF